MKQYLEMLEHIMAHGVDKSDRTGTGTRSVFGYQMRFNLEEGFPVLTTKKLHLRSIIHELLWFLSGDTNIRYLHDNNVSIWDEWADENGDLGPVYGYQWRSWPAPKFVPAHSEGSEWIPSGYKIEAIDQISQVIEQIKNSPDSRRLIVTAWNPADVDKMALPPCHCLFQFYTTPLSVNERLHLLDFAPDEEWVERMNITVEKHTALDTLGVPRSRLSCQLYQRSCDTFLGVPFNIASYALLTMMVAQVCDMVPGEFIWTGGDVHIYSNHFEQVALQLSRNTLPLPQMRINPKVKSIFDFRFEDFELVGYDAHPHIKAPIAV